jgi:hypothetical protein
VTRVLYTIAALAFSAQAASAMLLSCFPARTEGPVKIDAYVDGFVPGGYPPKEIEAVRILARFGEDVFEFFPEQTRIARVRDGVLHIHLLQPLSAGETAEIRFEGKIGAKPGEQFAVRMFIRSERRSAEASVRCMIE